MRKCKVCKGELEYDKFWQTYFCKSCGCGNTIKTKKERRINTILFRLVAITILISLVLTTFLVLNVRADDLSERIDRMNIELTQRNQREPIEIELQRPQNNGDNIIVNNYYTNIVNKYFKTIIKNITKNVTKNYITYSSTIVNNYYTYNGNQKEK